MFQCASALPAERSLDCFRLTVRGENSEQLSSVRSEPGDHFYARMPEELKARIVAAADKILWIGESDELSSWSPRAADLYSLVRLDPATMQQKIRERIIAVLAARRHLLPQLSTLPDPCPHQAPQDDLLIVDTAQPFLYPAARELVLYMREALSLKRYSAMKRAYGIVSSFRSKSSAHHVGFEHALRLATRVGSKDLIPEIIVHLLKSARYTTLSEYAARTAQDSFLLDMGMLSVEQFFREDGTFSVTHIRRALECFRKIQGELKPKVCWILGEIATALSSPALIGEAASRHKAQPSATYRLFINEAFEALKATGIPVASASGDDQRSLYVTRIHLPKYLTQIRELSEAVLKRDPEFASDEMFSALVAAGIHEPVIQHAERLLGRRKSASWSWGSYECASAVECYAAVGDGAKVQEVLDLIKLERTVLRDHDRRKIRASIILLEKGVHAYPPPENLSSLSNPEQSEEQRLTALADEDEVYLKTRIREVKVRSSEHSRDEARRRGYEHMAAHDWWAAYICFRKALHIEGLLAVADELIKKDDGLNALHPITWAAALLEEEQTP